MTTRHAAGAARFLLGLISISCVVPTGHAQSEKPEWRVSGFVDARWQVYGNAPTRHDAATIARLEGRMALAGPIGENVSLRGSWEFGADSHSDVDERRWLDVDQRALRRSAGALGDLYVDVALGRLDLRLGKQEIRWGRADSFNPTANLTPFDYLDPLTARWLAAPAAKADLQMGESNIEVAWLPTFVPTRLPRLNRRWFPSLPATGPAPSANGTATQVPVLYRDGDSRFPAVTLDDGQWGARWNRFFSGGEVSVSWFDGFDDVAWFEPAVVADVRPEPHLLVTLNRDYGRVRVAGFDFATAVGYFGVRGEFAMFDDRDVKGRNRLVYIVGVDRAWREWFLVVEYADWVGARVSAFSERRPDLGLKRTVLARITRPVGPRQSVELQGAVRLRDSDFLVRPLYSRALTDLWRLELSVTIVVGSSEGYLGQYAQNDAAEVRLRYAF